MAERGLLLAEDEALKAKLSNITVAAPREKGGRKKAKVWYGMPSGEREKDYPFITIDLLDIVFAADRAHSAQIGEVDYWPSEYPTIAEWAAANNVPYDPDNNIVEATWFHPYDIYYQVATYARTAQHDREMTATLMGTAYLPDRWGYLHVPADDSHRWLDRIGFSQADFLESAGQDDKRVYRKVYNVSVSAQLPPENPFLYYRVLTVATTLIAGEGAGNTTSWSDTFAPTP